MKNTWLSDYYPDFGSLAKSASLEIAYIIEKKNVSQSSADSGKIPEFRYHNYLRLLEEIMEKEKCYR